MSKQKKYKMFFLAIIVKKPSIFLTELVSFLSSTTQFLVCWPGQDIPSKPFTHFLFLPDNIEINVRDGLQLLNLKCFHCAISDSKIWKPSPDLIATTVFRYGLDVDPCALRDLNFVASENNVKQLLSVEKVECPIVLMTKHAVGKNPSLDVDQVLKEWTQKGGQVYMADPRPTLGLLSEKVDILVGHQQIIGQNKIK